MARSQTPPYSEETERAVLAAVLLKPELLDDELDVDTSCFHLERHQLLWRAIAALHAEGEPVDARTLQAHMEREQTFAPAGGLAYLTALDLDLPDLGRVGAYCRILRDRAARRRLVEMGQRLTQQAHADASAGELAGRYRRLLEDIEGEGAASGRWASDLLSGVVEDAQARRSEREQTGEAVLGLRTGIPRLDQLLCGLNRGLYLLAGPPGGGKTSLALQLALNVAREHPVLFVTYENAASNLVTKALCSHAEVSPRDVVRGFADVGALEGAAGELGPQLRRLHLVEGDASLTVGRLRSIARHALEHHGASRGLVVFDYLQLAAKLSQELRTLTDVRSRVDALGGELIALSRRLDSPVLALSSQSRAGGGYGRGGGRAALDSLKESGDLEYAADVALFLTPEESDEPAPSSPQPVRALELAVKKNRHGPTGSVAVTFQAERGVFYETESRR